LLAAGEEGERAAFCAIMALEEGTLVGETAVGMPTVMMVGLLLGDCIAWVPDVLLLFGRRGVETSLTWLFDEASRVVGLDNWITWGVEGFFGLAGPTLSFLSLAALIEQGSCRGAASF
jgi:hypothetical protein